MIVILEFFSHTAPSSSLVIVERCVAKKDKKNFYISYRTHWIRQCEQDVEAISLARRYASLIANVSLFFHCTNEMQELSSVLLPIFTCMMKEENTKALCAVGFLFFNYFRQRASRSHAG